MIHIIVPPQYNVQFPGLILWPFMVHEKLDKVRNKYSFVMYDSSEIMPINDKNLFNLLLFKYSIIRLLIDTIIKP